MEQKKHNFTIHSNIKTKLTKMTRLLLLIFTITIPIQGYSKKGPFFLSSKSGNVETLIIIDDTNSAEIQNIKRIGELCNLYLLDSDYRDVPVYIWYGHPPNLDKNRDSIYLSYDKGKTKFYLFDRRQYRRSQLLEKEGLIIRIITSDIDSRLILQLLEYGLQNKDYIKNNQKKASYSYWTWQSLPRKYIDQQLLQFNHSQKIDSLLKSAIEPERIGTH